MKVIARIQGRETTSGTRPNPVDMPFYQGDNMLQVVHAVTTVIAQHEDSPFYELLSITVNLED
jgi:hypothetical protein